MTVPYTFTAADAAACVRAPRRDDDKYRRGVVGVRTGSSRYPGAAVLGVEAAWRTGIGMVRYLGPERAQRMVVQARPETVTAEGRVQAWVLGSGTDASERTAEETEALRGLLAGHVPVVVDAGALDLVAPGQSAPRVLTPHRRELAALRERLGREPIDGADEASRLRAAQDAAAATGAIVLAKGALTLVVAPSGHTIRVDAATPWLATAGTGDVLAGVLGALLAGAWADREHGGADGAHADDDLAMVAAAAAWIHGAAGVRAAQWAGAPAPAGGPITAMDVAGALPVTIASLLDSAGAP